MATTIDVQEAKTHFSKLLQRAIAGERIIIAKAGKPVAQVGPISEPSLKGRVPGGDEGKVFIHEDFDDPLPEFEECM
jgi:prevent-host-death family protein